MKVNLLVKFDLSPESNYIQVKECLHESHLQDHYKQSIDDAKYFGIRDKVECLEGYKLQYISVNVQFDGRKKQPDSEDILNSLVRQGMAIKTGESLFGGFFKPTEELHEIFHNQLQQRKELIKQGKFQLVS